MVVLVIVLIIAVVWYKFMISMSADNNDLKNESLSNKFKIIVSSINEIAYGGMGKIKVFDNKSFNLYRTDSNQIIDFEYSAGSLHIIWRYKYLQKEVVFKKQFNNMRNISIFDQQNIVDSIISDMQELVGNHKRNVDSSICNM